MNSLRTLSAKVFTRVSYYMWTETEPRLLLVPLLPRVRVLPGVENSMDNIAAVLASSLRIADIDI